MASRVAHVPPPFSLWTEDPGQNQWALWMCRPDFVFSKGVPKLMEVNFNSAIGGITQLTKLNQIYWENPLVSKVAGSLPVSSLDPGVALCDMLRGLARTTGTDSPQVVVLGYRSHVDDLGREAVFAEVVKALRTGGVPAVHACPEDVRVRDGAAYVGELRVDIILRTFVTADAPEAGIELTSLRQVIDERAALVLAPEAAEPYASKRVLAWLTRAAADLPAAERELVRRHLPVTFDLGDPSSLPGATDSDRRTWLRSEQADLVLKGYQGHSGASVHVGRSTSPGDWEVLVDDALASGTAVVQEFVEPDTLTLPVYDRKHRRARTVEFKTVFSPLLLGERCGGLVVRQMPSGGGYIVNAQGGGAANMAFRVGRKDSPAPRRA
ncbi:hypothetical protein [Nocardiopsis synnemataformans]|uniref:hypothetical protein n=1 Tax=Nocardiopsis synnemataformans TaxID=61305 RepID=UPI003EB6F33D